METSEIRLTTILKEIDTHYINSKPVRMIDKHELYQKLKPLIVESKKLIEDLKKEITEIKPLESTNTNQFIVNYYRINQLIEWLSSPHLKFDEILSCVNELKKIHSFLPNKPQITDNIEEAVIYEDQDTDDFN